MGFNPKWGAFKNTLSFFFFFSGPHLSWFFGSSHSPLGFSELATIMASSSHDCPLLWQKLSMLVNVSH
jgi:hypothetical protein